jgi:Methyltransferase domain
MTYAAPKDDWHWKCLQCDARCVAAIRPVSCKCGGQFTPYEESPMLDKPNKKAIATLVKNGMAKIKPPKDGEFKLDIGCGERKQEGHIGIDICACPGVDHVMDVRKYPWPIDDDVVDFIFTSHFFEHLDGPERVEFMDECWRILKVGAQMRVIVPYWSSQRAIQDPYHKFPPIAETSFLYFVEHWRQDNKLTHYPIKCNFNFGYGYAIDPELTTRSDDYQQMAIKNYIRAVNDLDVTLTKVELGKR